MNPHRYISPLPLPLTVHVTVVGVVDVVGVLEGHMSRAFVVDLLGGGHRYSAVVRGAGSLQVLSFQVGTVDLLTQQG